MSGGGLHFGGDHTHQRSRQPWNDCMWFKHMRAFFRRQRMKRNKQLLKQCFSALFTTFFVFCGFSERPTKLEDFCRDFILQTAVVVFVLFFELVQIFLSVVVFWKKMHWFFPEMLLGGFVVKMWGYFHHFEQNISFCLCVCVLAKVPGRPQTWAPTLYIISPTLTALPPSTEHCSLGKTPAKNLLFYIITSETKFLDAFEITKWLIFAGVFVEQFSRTIFVDRIFDKPSCIGCPRFLAETSKQLLSTYNASVFWFPLLRLLGLELSDIDQKLEA